MAITDDIKSFLKEFTGINSFIEFLALSKKAVPVIESLDAALADLKKTSKMTTEQLDRFYAVANDIAKQTGASTEAIIKQAAAWSRLGYSSGEAAAKLAKLSSQFALISPGMDLDTATKGLADIMKAYDIDVNDVLDGIESKVNIVGKNFSLTNTNIVSMLQDSASAMAEANNTLEETIALETAAFEIIQDDSIGDGFKAAALRLRGLNEETALFDEALSTISNDLYNLTGVSIMEDAATYKSTYQILKELSEVWGSLNDSDKSSALSLIFGDSDVNIGKAVIENFQTAENAINAMAHSAGNADAEIAEATDTIEYKLNALKETGTGIAENLFQRDEMKSLIDLLTKFAEALDWLTDKLGLFGSSLVSLGAYKGFKNLLGGNNSGGILKKLFGYESNKNIMKDIREQLKEKFNDSETKVNIDVEPNVNENAKDGLFSKLKTFFSEAKTSYKETINAQSSLNKVLESGFKTENIDEYVKALDGFNETQKIAAINYTNLNSFEKELLINRVKNTIATNENTIANEANSASDMADTASNIENIQSTKSDTAATNENTIATNENTIANGANSASDMADTASNIKNVQSLGSKIGSALGSISPYISGAIASIASLAVLIGGSIIASNYVEKKKAEKKEEIRQAGIDAQKEIENINSSYDDTKETTEDIIKNLSKLSKGVDTVTKKNKTLSNDEYEEFLYLNNQLAELFPKLSKSYDENGNAILDLNSDTETFINTLYDLLQAEKDLAIIEKLPEVFNGLKVSTEKSKNSLNVYEEELEKQNDALKQLEEVKYEIQNGYINISAQNEESFRRLFSIYLDAVGKTTADYTIGELKSDENGYTRKIYLETDEESVKKAILENISESQSEEVIKKNIETLTNKILVKKNEINSEWSSISSSFSSWLSINSSEYRELSDSIQKLVLKSINNLDYAELDFDSLEDMQSWILNSILPLFHSDSVQSIVNDLFTIDFSKLPLEDARTSITQYINDILKIANNLKLNGIDSDFLLKTLGLDGYTTAYDNYKFLKDKIARDIIGVSTEEGMNNKQKQRYDYITDKIDQFAAEYSINTQDEIAALNDAFEEANGDIDKAFENYKNYLNLISQKDKITLSSLFSATDNNAIDLYQNRLQTIQEALENLRDGELQTADVTDLLQELMSEDMGFELTAEQVDMATSSFSGLRDLLLSLSNDALEDLLTAIGNLNKYEDPAAVEAWIEAFKNMQKEATKAAESLSSVNNAITGINSITDALDNLSSAYQSMKSGDGIEFDDLVSLQESFGDLDSFYGLAEALTNNPSLTEEVQKAFDAVITEFLNNEDRLQDLWSKIDVDNAGFYEKWFSNFGIGVINGDLLEAVEKSGMIASVNTAAEKIAHTWTDAIAKNTDISAILSADEDQLARLLDKINNGKLSVGTFKTGQFNDILEKVGLSASSTTEQLEKFVNALKISTSASVKDAVALVNEANASDEARQYLASLVAEKYNINSVKLSTSDDVNNLIKFADTCNIAASELQKFYDLRDAYNYIEKYNERLESRYYDNLNSEVKKGAQKLAESYQKIIDDYKSNYEDWQIDWSEVLSYDYPNTLNLDNIFDYSGKALSDAAEDTSETFDWIETKITRMDEALDRLDSKTSDTYSSWTDRNNALIQSITKTQEAIDLQQQAYEAYMKEADLVGLPDTYKKLVQTGALNAKDVVDSNTADQISEYQDLYEKAIQCLDKAQELKQTLNELSFNTKWNNIKTELDAVINTFDSDIDLLQNEIDKLELQGLFANSSYYADMASLTQKKISTLISEANQLQSILNNMSQDREEYDTLFSELMDIRQEIAELENDCIEFNNNIRDLDWEIFEYLEESINRITGETEYLVELLSKKDLYNKDNGNLTKYADAVLGLHAANYDVYKKQAQDYYEEVQELQKQLVDGAGQDVLEQYNEMVDAHQDAILAAEDEKQAILDLIEDGYNAQLDAIQELIDKKKEQLDAEKNLYDYQKSIAEKTDNIASLEKQKLVYEGDTSEEAMSKIQQIKVELAEAKADLAETEYEQYLSDTENMLDQLTEDYEFWMNARLDNEDALLSEIVSTIAGKSDEINTTLNEIADEYGTHISDTIISVFNADSPFTDALTGGLSQVSNSIAGNTAAIENLTDKILGITNTQTNSSITGNGISSSFAGTNSSDSTVNADTSGSASSKSSTNAAGSSLSDTDKSSSAGSLWGSWFVKKTDSYPKDKLNIDTSIVDRLKYNNIDSSFSARARYYSAMGGTGTYTSSASQNVWMLNQMKAHSYAKGSKYIPYDQIAKTQENGEEIIYRASDGAMFTPLGQGDMVFTNESSKKLWEFAQNPIEYLQKLGLENLVPQFNVVAPALPNMAGNSKTASMETTIGDIEISLPNVTNYKEFRNSLIKDSDFEKAMFTAINHAVTGKGTSLDKLKYAK